MKSSVSPDRKPPLIDTKAPVSLPALSTSATVKVPSSVTGEPPPSKVAVAPAVTVGATCTTVSVLPPVAELSPSSAVQAMVRLVAPPPWVGSPFAGLKL